MNIVLETKKVLLEKGWTQERLAKEAGIHHVTLCRLLKNPRKPESAYDKLANYLSRYKETGDA